MLTELFIVASVPESGRGRAYAAIGIATTIGQAIGYVVSGPLLEAFDARWVILGTSAAVLAQIVMSARVLFGLGRFWAPFHVFHQAHPRFGTPVAATLAAGAIVILLAIFAPIDQLAAATSIILLIVFIAINGALIALRRGGGPRGGFRTPIIVPVAGVVLSIGALIWALAV